MGSWKGRYSQGEGGDPTTPLGVFIHLHSSLVLVPVKVLGYSASDRREKLSSSGGSAHAHMVAVPSEWEGQGWGQY